MNDINAFAAAEPQVQQWFQSFAKVSIMQNESHRRLTDSSKRFLSCDRVLPNSARAMACMNSMLFWPIRSSGIKASARRIASEAAFCDS